MEYDDEEDTQLVVAQAEEEPTAQGASQDNRATRVAAVQPLCFKTDHEDKYHTQKCCSSTCVWCKSVDFLKKHDHCFNVVDSDFLNSDQYKGLKEKDKVLASTSWLAKAHRSCGNIVFGCLPCRALSIQNKRRCNNILAEFCFPAEKLFTASGKPHVLLRHAKTELHQKAVAAYLGEGAASWHYQIFSA